MRLLALVGCLSVGCFTKPASPDVDLEIVFDNLEHGTLRDFQALVRLDAELVGGAGVVDPTTDLRFYDPDADTDLAFDVDTWNPAAESLVWIRVPEIPGGSTDKRVLMFVGPGIGAADPNATWSELAGVWHLTANGDRYANSAGSSYTGTGMQLDDTAGEIGPGAGFRGPDSTIELDAGPTLFDAWEVFTLEMWIELGTPSPNEPVVIDMPAADQPLRGGRILPSPSRMQIDIQFESGTTFQNVGLVAGFNYVVFTFDGQRLSVYGNGAAEGSETASPRLIPATVQPQFGGFNAFEGVLDEVRISRVARDADWVATQHRSMIGTFATVRRAP